MLLRLKIPKVKVTPNLFGGKTRKGRFIPHLSSPRNTTAHVRAVFEKHQRPELGRPILAPELARKSISLMHFDLKQHLEEIKIKFKHPELLLRDLLACGSSKIMASLAKSSNIYSAEFVSPKDGRGTAFFIGTDSISKDKIASFLGKNGFELVEKKGESYYSSASLVAENKEEDMMRVYLVPEMAKRMKQIALQKGIYIS